LHVLGTPPAFVLSQDQTLQKESWLAFNSAPTPKVSSASAFHIVQLQRLALSCQITFPLEVQALQRVKNIWLRELIAALQHFYVDASFCSVFKEHSLKQTLVVNYGAGDGNRTHDISLEGWGFTTKLHPHVYFIKIK
jgi:hypothetical protein